MSAALLVAAMLISAPCDEAHSVNGGDDAPCSGVLLPLSEATHGLRCLTVGLPACEQDNVLCVGRERVEARAHEATVDALNERILSADQALLAMAKCPECERAWWDSPALGFAAGAITTAAVVVAILLGAK
jgi:hypothetical protein